jgi:hypothetical protein
MSSTERPTHPFGTITFDAVNGPIGFEFVSVSYLPDDGGGVVAAACGVTAFEGAEAGDAVVLFFAVTTKVYFVPLVKPLTVALRLAAAATTEMLPGVDVTVYEAIALEPLFVGACQVTVADALPAVAVTLVGAVGAAVVAAAGVTALDGEDAAPVAVALFAVTVKV